MRSRRLLKQVAAAAFGHGARVRLHLHGVEVQDLRWAEAVDAIAVSTVAHRLRAVGVHKDRSAVLVELPNRQIRAVVDGAWRQPALLVAVGLPSRATTAGPPTGGLRHRVSADEPVVFFLSQLAVHGPQVRSGLLPRVEVAVAQPKEVTELVDEHEDRDHSDGSKNIQNDSPCGR